MEKNLVLYEVTPLIENDTILLFYKFKMTTFLSMMSGKLMKGFIQNLLKRYRIQIEIF